MIAARLVQAMEAPFSLSCGVVHVGVSVGVASSRPGSALSGHLLDRADRAMYEAKRQGGSRHHSVSPDA